MNTNQRNLIHRQQNPVTNNKVFKRTKEDKIIKWLKDDITEKVDKRKAICSFIQQTIISLSTSYQKVWTNTNTLNHDPSYQAIRAIGKETGRNVILKEYSIYQDANNLTYHNIRTDSYAKVGFAYIISW